MGKFFKQIWRTIFYRVNASKYSPRSGFLYYNTSFIGQPSANHMGACCICNSVCWYLATVASTQVWLHLFLKICYYRSRIFVHEYRMKFALGWGVKYKKSYRSVSITRKHKKKRKMNSQRTLEVMKGDLHKKNSVDKNQIYMCYVGL